jgi:teichuronic acid exporter
LEVSIKTKIINGSFLYLLRQLVVLILQLTTNFFVLKWISPSEFGYFSTVNVILSILQILSDGGLSVYFIQKKNLPTTSEINNLLTLQLFSYFVLHSVLIILYFLFLKTTILLYLIILLFSIPLNFFKSISFALLERNLNFSIISIIEILEIVSYSITVIFLAFKGYGVWSLVIAVIIKSIIGLVITFFKNPYNYKFTKLNFDLETKTAIKYGINYNIPNILNYFRILINPVVIGYYFGMYTVGLIDRAIFVAGLPLYILGAVQQKILFPFFSKIQNSKIEVSNSFYKSFYYSNILDKLFYIPLLLFLHVIFFKYFNKWVEIMPFFYILIVGNILFGSFSFSIYPALNGIGKTSSIAKLSILSISFSWVLIYPLTLIFHRYSYAVLSILIWLIGLIPTYAILIKNIGKINLIKPFFVPIVSFIPIILFSFYTTSKNDFDILYMILYTALSFISYLLIIYLMDSNILIEMTNIFLKNRQKDEN